MTLLEFVDAHYTGILTMTFVLGGIAVAALMNNAGR